MKANNTMGHLQHVRLALVFKDFAAWLHSSCVGLNVAGYTTAAVLCEHGVETDVFPVRNNVDVVHAIDRYNETHAESLTHVVISAPWLSVYDLRHLVEHFKQIEFAVLCHSNVGFLQADPQGVLLLRRYQELAESVPNLKIGGNCAPFVAWFEAAYGKRTVLLPNLYPIPKRLQHRSWRGSGPLKIGAFGAVRPYKNFMTAAAAAIVIQRALGLPTEFHMSTGGECGTVDAIEQMYSGLDGMRLVKHPWQTWDGFIRIVAEMDLLLQPSYTESFNLITADGISVGVPSVVSSSIRWAPDEWKADSDDAADVARVGLKLLGDGGCGPGLAALRKHNEHGLYHWRAYLERQDCWEDLFSKWLSEAWNYFTE